MIAAATPFFLRDASELWEIHNEAMSDAAQVEKYVGMTLCLSGKLCSGDQQGFFDWFL